MSTGIAARAANETSPAAAPAGTARRLLASGPLVAVNRALERRGIYLMSQGRFGWRRLARTAVVVGLDFLAVAGTLALCLDAFNVEHIGRVDTGPRFIAAFAAIAAFCFLVTGLYRRNWRFVTMADCSFLLPMILGGLAITWSFMLGATTLRNHGLSVMALAVVHFSAAALAMQSMRMLRRAGREYLARREAAEAAPAASRTAKRALLLGSPDWAVSVIEMLKSDNKARMVPVGVLLPGREDTITQLRGVPVLGRYDKLDEAIEQLAARGRRPDQVIVCDDGIQLSPKDLARMTHRVRELGLELSRLADPCSQLLQRQPKVDFDNLPLTELLGRTEFNIGDGAISRQVAGHCVLVTGAGGTIGGELVSQLASFRPSRLVLLDNCEYNLYAIEMRLRERYPDVELHPELCNITDASEVRRVFDRHRPTIVYHAAALKHVPMVELNPCAGAHTNIIGTRNVAEAVTEFSARAMIQVSTDKAVNPIGMMGATKRVGELYCQSLDLCGTDDPEAPRFMTVRFGNVLGSSGSVVPLFKRQLLEGRPLTVTHPDIERFFMTVREAVHLILESSSRGLEENTSRGSIFVLDMGAPVKILDLARRMAELYGLGPDCEVPIQFTGLRPGEKLFEELFDTCEEEVDSGIPGLFEARSKPIPLPLIARAIDQLTVSVREGNDEEAREITHNLVRLPSSGLDMTNPFGSKAVMIWRTPIAKMIKEA